MSRPSRPLGSLAAVACVLAGLAGAALAGSALGGCASTSDEELPPAGVPGWMSPEQQQAMEDFIEQQQPGEKHAALEPLVGHFEAQVKQWMDPGAPPMESAGVLENSWVLGGRFVLSVFRGQDAGAPFEGMGLLGYDTLKQKYVSNWADSMGTGLWPTAIGEGDDSGDSIALSRVMTDPMTGGLIKIRDVTTIVDHDHITYEMFLTRPGADEFKMLEAHYIRT